jgi:hypothetical protein
VPAILRPFTLVSDPDLTEVMACINKRLIGVTVATSKRSKSFQGQCLADCLIEWVESSYLFAGWKDQVIGLRIAVLERIEERTSLLTSDSWEKVFVRMVKKRRGPIKWHNGLPFE